VPDDRREQDAWLEQLRAKYDGPPRISPGSMTSNLA